MRLNKNKLAYLLLGIFSACLWVFGMRFLLVDQDLVHHHANFAVYIDGNRDKLESFTFYEEVAACSTDNEADPKARVHLHDQNPYTVHVHDAGSTWGHLFANLGYGLTNESFVNDDGVYQTTDSKELTFMLNGKVVKYVANLAINSEDVLLIDYGSSNESTLLQRYEQIPKDAAEYNLKPDPASCSGGSEEAFWDRFKRTLGIS